MHIHRTAEQIAADRQRYEEHQRVGLEFSPKTLPTPSPRPGPVPEEGSVAMSRSIPGGWYTTLRLSRGEVLRLERQGPVSAVSLAGWAAKDTTERMNLPDTVKLQWTTELKKGRVVFSDMGRVMLSIVEDSAGAHDALTGGSTPATVAQYGDPNLRNTRDNMVLAAAKLGLDRCDLMPLLNLFAPVRVDAEGQFEWRAGMIGEGDWVALRAEMDLLIALSNCPHPLDPRAGEVPAPLEVTKLKSVPVPEDDLCRTATAEAQRGFENNAKAEG
ncbi:urea amidolyase associated protein UAAP1 [uncultured Roseobacter sp.]|uniref:urea amidolyase associated protein UAAP1 n=1 Tax=uncultured Roseobacter sp. TaxID=114847 RepID=UPI00262346A5|nr:urea amidolyase associated protein UAAP1 [uncultured Roseobacter sp.]